MMLKHVIQHAALWEHENITQARKEEKVKFITYTFNYKGNWSKWASV